MGAELRRLDAVVGARTPAAVAIVFDWESWWALELDAHPSRNVRLLEQVGRYYAPLFDRNIAVDFVAPDADLARYRVVLVPNLYLVRAGVAENLERFTAAGGTLVMSFFSGIADAEDHILLGGYPAPFRTLLGLRVEEFDPYAPGQTNGLIAADGCCYECDLWSDVIHLEGAEAIATFERDFYAGGPAVTRHAYGNGTAYYVGTRPVEGYMTQLLEGICRDTGVSAPLDAPLSVEVTRRVAGENGFLFALNHSANTVEFSLPRPVVDVLTGQGHEGSVKLGPREVAIWRES